VSTQATQQQSSTMSLVDLKTMQAQQRISKESPHELHELTGTDSKSVALLY
jgi:hypothetical protein